ncbi:BLUF domain-containing protein [Salinimicrobium sp. HB62]|uniref:BLUF domain-containing protein n=1 Tax=Salinimicrobium sp. HB62 TaxID=3077781 RepID=UPI002D779D89|nr:BLUF domain-containing protein [Salinimicrobium sp. HB62]
MKHVICYISTATKHLDDKEVEALMKEWQEQNSKQNIKGILLYSEGHFFQVLEGEKESVLSLFQEIQQDSRHTSVIQVLGKDVNRGSLDGYVVEHLKSARYSKPEVIGMYCGSVKGMDPKIQEQIKVILGSFIDTQVL